MHERFHGREIHNLVGKYMTFPKAKLVCFALKYRSTRIEFIVETSELTLCLDEDDDVMDIIDLTGKPKILLSRVHLSIPHLH
jgi:hypothetical protein